jgi:DNA-binding XRE family transcriptional regulator
MQLIEQRRERLGMSKRAAAAFAGISEVRWRQLENGGRQIAGNWIPESAPDLTLARMALAVRLTPESIEPFSPRAAQMLGDLNAEREAADGADADDAARMVDALGGRKLTVRQHHALVTEVTEALRRIRSE